MSAKERQRRHDKRRKTILGKDIGAAQRSLLRKIAFLYFYEKQKGKCFRCSELLSFDSWHLDHIKSWMRAVDPKASFFDLANLAASHSQCNRNARDLLAGTKTNASLKIPVAVVKSQAEMETAADENKEDRAAQKTSR